MEALIFFNTVINVLLIGWWVYRNNRLYICASRTDHGEKLIGINVMWNHQPLRKGVNASALFYIPIRSYKKQEVRDKVLQLISTTPEHRSQSIRAMFSWLKTNEEVQEFKKNYSIVNEKLVTELVRNFNID